jgi:hypothetical protein
LRELALKASKPQLFVKSCPRDLQHAAARLWRQLLKSPDVLDAELANTMAARFLNHLDSVGKDTSSRPSCAFAESPRMLVLPSDENVQLVLANLSAIAQHLSTTQAIWTPTGAEPGDEQCILSVAWLCDKVCKVARKAGSTSMLLPTTALAFFSSLVAFLSVPAGEKRLLSLEQLEAVVAPMFKLILHLQNISVAMTEFAAWQECIQAGHMLQEALLSLLGVDAHSKLFAEVSKHIAKRKLSRHAEEAVLKLTSPNEAAIIKSLRNSRRYGKKKLKREAVSHSNKLLGL